MAFTTKDWKQLPSELQPAEDETVAAWRERIAAYATANPSLVTPLNAAALEDLETRLGGYIDAHLTDTSAAHAATAIGFTPAGNLASTDVGAALVELDTEKQAVSAKGQVNGYAPLNSSARVPVANLGSGTADGTKFLRDDGTFTTPAGGAGWLPVVVTSTADAVAAAGELHNFTASGTTLTLPTAPGAAALVGVVHSDVGSPSGVITVTAPAGGTIHGVSSYTLSTLRQSAVFYCIGGNTWKVVAVNGVGKADLGSDGKVLDAQLPAAQSGHVIEDEGTPLTARSNLNFTGAGVSVADSGGKTVVSISGAGVADADASTKGVVQLAGDLAGTAASPQIAPGVIVNADINASAAIAESKLALASDAAAGTPSRRSLGTTGTTAAAGDDARFTNARTPSDASVTLAKVASSLLAMLPGAVAWDGTGTQPARPVGFPVVFWVCPVDPAANVLDNDVWITTAAP